MRTLVLGLATLLLLSLVPLPTAAAEVDPFPFCPTASPDYCVDVDNGEVCYTVHLGDLEGPYTRCESLPTTMAADLPGKCTGYGDHYCYEVTKDGVCLTYDLGDLEGPYHWCWWWNGVTEVGTICTWHLIESISACVGNGCVTVYTGPSATPVCVQFTPLPRVCTIDLFQAAGVCVQGDCATIYVGAPRTVCVPDAN